MTFQPPRPVSWAPYDTVDEKLAAMDAKVAEAR